ncbi:histidine kinase [Arachidicoccus ginsenosidimutans]|nr:histidine kinase [Arachidicoccus sp. BS20]
MYMFQNLLNWRYVLVLIAVAIVIGSLFYSRHLSEKLAKIEEKEMHIWVEAQKEIADTSSQTNLNLSSLISSENRDIPIIETNEHDSIVSSNNLDTTEIAHDENYLKRKLSSFKKLHEPILVKLNDVENKYYYGESRLQQELRYFPIVQLLIVALFIIILIVAERNAHKSTQNRLWVGMAKETAHQLGTPVSSLEGWTEILKNIEGNETVVPEMDKDIQRLKLISDRFAKIGSVPKLEGKDIVVQIQNMVEYIRKRAGGNVRFSVDASQNPLYAQVSAPLFDWVIENLLKNALDAMDGQGAISIKIQQQADDIFIDVSDTGKGIPHAQFKKVFIPGFTTKKRGWGLGLALTKRIVEEYHHGNIFVKSSEVGKGTTFRIVLKA